MFGAGIKYIGRKNLLLYVTHSCNQRCRHCFYLRNINQGDHGALTVSALKEVIRNFPKFRLVSLTGGEPLLRPDLKEFVSLLSEHLDMEEVEINTNGSLPEATIDFCKFFIKTFPRKILLIQLSLLGPEKIHDVIANQNGSFGRLTKTARLLRQLQSSHKKLNIIFCIPMMRTNYQELPFFFKYARENGIPIKFSPLKSIRKTVSCPSPEYLNQDFVVDDESLFLTPDEYAGFVEEANFEAKKFNRSLWPYKDRLRNNRYLCVNRGIKLGTCRSREKSVVIFPNGDYGICETLRPIGNIFKEVNGPLCNKKQISFLMKETEGCFCGHGDYLFRVSKLFDLRCRR